MRVGIGGTMQTDEAMCKGRGLGGTKEEKTKRGVRLRCKMGLVSMFI